MAAEAEKIKWLPELSEPGSCESETAELLCQPVLGWL